MTRDKIKIGEVYRTKGEGNFFHGIDLIINKVENPESLDGLGHFRTENLMHRRKNHTARIWWFKEFCYKVKKASQ